jgi:hypothetical protein
MRTKIQKIKEHILPPIMQTFLFLLALSVVYGIIIKYII